MAAENLLLREQLAETPGFRDCDALMASTLTKALEFTHVEGCTPKENAAEAAILLQELAGEYVRKFGAASLVTGDEEGVELAAMAECILSGAPPVEEEDHVGRFRAPSGAAASLGVPSTGGRSPSRSITPSIAPAGPYLVYSSIVGSPPGGRPLELGKGIEEMNLRMNQLTSSNGFAHIQMDKELERAAAQSPLPVAGVSERVTADDLRALRSKGKPSRGNHAGLLARVHGMNTKGSALRFPEFAARFFASDWHNLCTLYIFKLGHVRHNWRERVVTILPSGEVMYMDPKAHKVCGVIDMLRCKCVLEFADCRVRWPSGVTDGLGLYVPEKNRTYYIGHKRDTRSHFLFSDFRTLLKFLATPAPQPGSGPQVIQNGIAVEHAIGLVGQGMDREVERGLEALSLHAAASEKTKDKISRGALAEVVRVIKEASTALAVKHAVCVLMNLALGSSLRRQDMVKKHGVHLHLAALMQSWASDIRRDVAGALWNLCVDLETAKLMAVPEVVKALQAAQAFALEVHDRILLVNATAALLILDTEGTVAELFSRELSQSKSSAGGAGAGESSMRAQMQVSQGKSPSSPRSLGMDGTVDGDTSANGVVICFHPSQRDRAEQMHDALADELSPMRVLLCECHDKKTYFRVLARQLLRASAVVLLLSSEYEASRNCVTEAVIATRLQKPVIVGKCSNTWAPRQNDTLDQILTTKSSYSLHSPHTFSESIRDIAKEIRRDEHDRLQREKRERERDKEDKAVAAAVVAAAALVPHQEGPHTRERQHHEAHDE